MQQPSKRRLLEQEHTGGLLVLLWLASRERMLWATVPPREVEGRD